MIDFHNHILPNLDDGSKSTEMSIEMLKIAESQGITEVVSTVHYQHPKMDGINLSYNKVLNEVKNLQKEIDRLSIHIKLHFGAEVFFLPNLIQLKDDPLATFGHGKYMLIEFQPHQIPEIHRQQLFDLKMSGVTPIIAHPERYTQVQNDSKIIENWLNAGCLIQVDAGSLLGTFGTKSKACSEMIIKNNWCHIIGSDSHNNKRRNFCLGEVTKILKKKFNNKMVDQMIYYNPKSVIEGIPINIDFEYEPLEKKSKFFNFKLK